MNINRTVKVLLERVQSPGIDRVSVRLARFIFRRWGFIPSFFRSMLLSLWSTDPLSREKALPEIDLAIVFAQKDAELVPAAVLAAVDSSSNPIKVVRLVTPNLENPIVRMSIGAVETASSRLKFSLEVYDDKSLLGSDRLRQLQHHQVPDRNLGWVTQQLLKLSAVLISPQRATLIVDADTILLRRRVWLARDGRQILMAPEWYRSLWTEDVERFLGFAKTLPFSFIAHHQLMQKDVVEELFGSEGQRLLEWALSARRRIAEYETYGTYLAEVHPERTVLARFGNIEDPNRSVVASVSSREALFDLVKEYGPRFLSLSVHHYLDPGEPIRGQ